MGKEDPSEVESNLKEHVYQPSRCCPVDDETFKFRINIFSSGPYLSTVIELIKKSEDQFRLHF